MEERLERPALWVVDLWVVVAVELWVVVAVELRVGVWVVVVVLPQPLGNLLATLPRKPLDTLDGLPQSKPHGHGTTFY
jgi:hypothetical protein